MNQKKCASPMLLTDFYKQGHISQYPKGISEVYSTLTCRFTYKENMNETVFFGLQKFIKEYLIDNFNENFFKRDLEEVLAEYKQVIGTALNQKEVNTKHIEDLHALGYLPIKICSVAEGTIVPLKVPILTIQNTKPEFYWVTNFLETILSAEIWQPITSATISLEFRKLCEKYADTTCDNNEHVTYQCHDFSMRGMQGLDSVINSGMGHHLLFNGTDSIPAILGAAEYYPNPNNEILGSSIPATEHSVMCSYGQDGEIGLLKHLLTEVYPSGMFSAVCDTWDFWKVVSEYLPKLKDIIMAREGKLVIRPDSADPVDVICGTKISNGETPEEKGLIECLWDIFGGTTNSKGYKVLDSHIGAIFGDGITLDVARRVFEKLELKGFASSNIVFGVGSFTYTYNTRDSFGLALKTTYVVVDGEERKVCKKPKTDSSKTSQNGLVCVYEEDGVITYQDGFIKKTLEDFEKTHKPLLEPIFEDGKLLKEYSFIEVRERILSQI